MRCVVTGAAGFIGSHLAEELLRRGHTVVGLDSFIPYYEPSVKARNQAVLLVHPHYHFFARDLRTDNLEEPIAEADVVFHLAAMPGLPTSWTDFDSYCTCNVQGTERLLDAVREFAPRCRRFVLASTSSVYGKLALGTESSPTQPVSPYGVTKLAAENISRAYHEAFSIPLVTLRYFSVYGPRQRPDMAYHRFINSLIRGEPLEVYGDGHQIRGNTFVTDAVAATIAAVDAPVGEVYNVGGAEPASVLDVIAKLEIITEKKADIAFKASRTGDQRQTLADTSKLRNHLRWEPKISLDAGLMKQWQWQTETDYAQTPGPARKMVVPTHNRWNPEYARR